MDTVDAYERVIRLLSGRAHSRAELVRKLRARGAAREVAEAAVEKAARQGYVDDAEFAKSYARRARDTKGLAPARIRRELAQKGVDPPFVEDAIAESFAGSDLLPQARDLARRRALRLHGDTESKRRRLAAFLERRGFPAHVILAAVDEVAPRT
jgi:regulatory protein